MMMELLRLVAFVVLLVLVWQPVAMHRTLRLLGAEHLRRSSLLAGSYYAFVGGLITLVLVKDTRLFESLPDVVIGVVGTVGVALVPLTPLVLLVQRKLCRRRSGYCSCGYDLRGNPGRNCPECGREATPDQSLSARRRLVAIPRRALLISLGLVLFACLVEERKLYYCTECARSGTRVAHGFHIPLTELSWEAFPGVVRVTRADGRPAARLSNWLDASGTCPHNWQGYGATTDYAAGGKRFSCGLNAAECDQAWESDFGAFMAAHPEVIERIRESLRRREPIRSWLDPMVVGWRGAPYGPDWDPGHSD